jgi:hypothetical protein
MVFDVTACLSTLGIKFLVGGKMENFQTARL